MRVALSEISAAGEKHEAIACYEVGMSLDLYLPFHGVRIKITSMRQAGVHRDVLSDCSAINQLRQLLSSYQKGSARAIEKGIFNHQCHRHPVWR